MSRNAMLAKVHIAKKELGLDDETYRDMLESITGKRSAGKLSDGQLVVVLKTFKTHGFTPKKKHEFKKETDPQIRMALSLWSQLHKAKVVRDGSRSAFTSFVKRMTKVDRFEWLDRADLNIVIEALKAMCFRNNIEIER